MLSRLWRFTALKTTTSHVPDKVGLFEFVSGGGPCPTEDNGEIITFTPSYKLQLYKYIARP